MFENETHVIASLITKCRKRSRRSRLLTRSASMIHGL